MQNMKMNRQKEIGWNIDTKLIYKAYSSQVLLAIEIKSQTTLLFEYLMLYKSCGV